MLYIYEMPPKEGENKDMIVTVNGRQAPLCEAYISAMPFNRRWPGKQRSKSQRELAYFVTFESDESVTVVVKPSKQVHTAILRPQSKGINAEVKDGEIRFSLKESGGYILEIDGEHNPLHIFYNPVKQYPEKDNPQTLYYARGYHDIGILKLGSNSTVYIEEGAVVYGCIHAENATNINILGKGILDNSKNVEEILFDVPLGQGDVDVKNSKREHTIKLTNCKDIRIEGITIRDSLLYNITTFGCQNFLVDNVKIIGCWRYNSDGIDMHNSSHCVIKNCFVRTYDDSICVKAHAGYTDYCKDILVENCVVCNDWGKALEVGVETWAEKMHDITFRDCYVLGASDSFMDVTSVDQGYVYDVNFENIYAEYRDIIQIPQIQENDESKFVYNKDPSYRTVLIRCGVSKHHEYSAGEKRGNVFNINYNNIYVLSKTMPPSAFSGYNEAHGVKDIKIKNLYLNGKPVTTVEDAKLRIGEFASNITVE